ncbi:hypothetical protein ASPWEDRAFT_184072 [Aspergillus wentii DTO 134E9]|uniref:nitrilase n=1 Tax=Aspergillus wentii DTO 134E9 TaxID=1073089 RepID=A0A1L9RMD3_ASPWE|nr:uncharacterized protein ASPWEDRAFT_184072 [Aspergillus wentii DTO 134E9]KAI9929448.1 hypothetical protein MW887_000919 [Aspergillus wentii]OJJ36109.1 hypothetical protein ASPWEDRAFT_184072 [Aspergillus wentii DTO 134E9]
MSSICVGAVQAEPIYLNLRRAVNKTIDLIKEASEKGVEVLAFPEVWVGGYPWPIWSQSPFESSEFAAKYIAESLPRESVEMRRIQRACKEFSVFVVLGYSERDGGSIYMAQAFINAEGEIVHNRRKIKPTHVERALWGEGQADSLQCVVDSPVGKIGALNCWENMLPLLRYYEYSQGVQIHVAGWPAFPETPEDVEFPWSYSSTAEANYRVSQMVAMEGQTFVLCSTQIVKEDSHELLGLQDKGFISGSGGGFAMIFGPNGQPLAERVPADEEGILTATIDLSAIHLAKHMIDTVGHYSRPDLLGLKVNNVAAKMVHE